MMRNIFSKTITKLIFFDVVKLEKLSPKENITFCYYTDRVYDTISHQQTVVTVTPDKP